MGTQTRGGRKSQNPGTNNNNNNNNVVIGKGKVTPVQVAFIVDRYLADNNFPKTRSLFRSEASSLISNSSLNEAPKGLLSLGELLDEYIWLKEQKVVVDQQKSGLAQETSRIQSLLLGMQNVMNTYNLAAAAAAPVAPPVSAHTALMPAVSPSAASGDPASTTPVLTSVSMTQSVKKGHHAYSKKPIPGDCLPRKRKNNCKDVEDPPQAPKKIYSGPLANYPFRSKASESVGHTSRTSSQVGLPIRDSSVAKALFDKPSQSPTSNYCNPKTPPQDVSSTVVSHNVTAPAAADSAPTNCTIISSKTIIVSPSKRYSIERNKCTFSSPVKTSLKRQNEREHVKSRLDFDRLETVTEEDASPTTSESDNQGDMFDLDLSNFDAFAPDFSLSDFLTEFGIGSENFDCPPTAACTSSNAILGPLDETDSGELGTGQDLVKHSSAVTESIAADKAVNDADSITSVKSVRKCIRIVSPSKNLRNSTVQSHKN